MPFNGLPLLSSSPVVSPRTNGGTATGVIEVHNGNAEPAAGAAAGSMVTSVVVESATNHDRFQERSLPAARILKRYASGATWRVGYATPLTTGVSMKDSGVPDGFGMIGHCQSGGVVPVGTPIAAAEVAHGTVTAPLAPAVRLVIGGKNQAP